MKKKKQINSVETIINVLDIIEVIAVLFLLTRKNEMNIKTHKLLVVILNWDKITILVFVKSNCYESRSTFQRFVE